MTRKRQALIVVAALGLVAAPVVVAYGASEMVVTSRLGDFNPPLPEKTEVLKGRTQVQRVGDRCVAVVAKTVASELAPAKVGDFFAGERVLDAPLAVAWQRRSEFWVRNPAVSAEKLAGNEETRPADADLEVLPALPRKMLTQYAMLPKGVRRISVFVVLSWEGRWDPRCF